VATGRQLHAARAQRGGVMGCEAKRVGEVARDKGESAPRLAMGSVQVGDPEGRDE